jgi:hypothetical protein
MGVDPWRPIRQPERSQQNAQVLRGEERRFKMTNDVEQMAGVALA